MTVKAKRTKITESDKEIVYSEKLRETQSNNFIVSKTVKWVGAIIAAIIITLTTSSFALQRDTRYKAQYSYEAVERIEEDINTQKTSTVTKEQFIDYKEYQEKEIIEVKSDIKELKDGQKEIQQDVKEILKCLN